MTSTTPFVHRIKVRCGEVDMPGVVFNAHYLAYCDDAVETWLQTLGLTIVDHGWDFMLKKATIEWQGTATVHEVVAIDVGVDRWGNTSFDVGFVGRVGSRPVFTCTITYVGVAPGTTDTKAPPEHIKSLMSG